MEQATILRLKDNYLFFKDGNMMCVYDTKDSLVKLKFPFREDTDTYTLKRELAKPHTLNWLSKQEYFSWLGALINRYGDLFEVIDEHSLQWENAKNNLIELIARDSYAENVEVPMDFSESTLILYGLSKTNVMLANAVSDMNYKDIIMINRGELVEAEDIGDETGAYFYQDLLKDKKDILTTYYEKRRGKVKIRNLNELDDLASLDKSVYIIDSKDLSKEELFRINHFITKNKRVAIFFKMQPEELVIGPLVVGGESTCLECLECNDLYDKYYGGKGVPMDSVFIYMLLFLVKRTLCYVKENDLYILLGDVQIPINKIFRINRITMRGEFDYVYRDIKCSCTA